MANTLTVGSLFAGIGGLELGLEWTGGFKTVWQVENDPYAQKVLAKHWPDVGRWDDVRTFPPAPAEGWRCDVLCGGPPCQPTSNAGKRCGTFDDRWLWPDALRIIRVLRPRVAILENPPAILSLDDGRAFGNILGELAEVGYDAEWGVLSACAMGAPHTRERLFVVAYASGSLRQAGIRLREHATPAAIQAGDSIASRVFRMEAAYRDSGVPNGVPARVDFRMRAIGNAVVPQVAQWIGERILEAINGEAQ